MITDMKNWKLYEWSVVLFFLIIPLAATLVDVYINSSNRLMVIAFKWFVFSGVGLRLGAAGIKQILSPEFTAKEIFNISDVRAVSVVRELGVANLCFSILAIISLFMDSFRIPAAVAGGLYFGLTGLLHVFKKKESNKEIFAMISDIYIFFVLSILLIFNL